MTAALLTGFLTVSAGPAPSDTGISAELPAEEQSELSRLKLAPIFSIGFPYAINIGAQISPLPKWELSLRGGFFPVPISSQASLDTISLESAAEWHFSGKPFFVGASLGYQRLIYRNNMKFNGLENALSNTVFELEDMYVAPLVGFSWKEDSGFFWGFEVGYQIPLFWGGGMRAESSSQDADTLSKVESLENSARDLMSHYAGMKKPYITLIRIGWILQP